MPGDPDPCRFAIDGLEQVDWKVHIYSLDRSPGSARLDVGIPRYFADGIIHGEIGQPV